MVSRWQRLKTYLRYDFPLHFVLWFTGFLPDNVIFLRLRGWLAKHFLGSCGQDLRLGRGIVVYNPINVKLGSHVYLAYGSVLLANDFIVIEDEVMLSPYVVIVSDNHSRELGSFRYGKPKLAPVWIKRGVWVGSHAVITAGVTIGEGSLVGAGAVVTRDIPDHVMAGGVPARVIKNLENE